MCHITQSQRASVYENYDRAIYLWTDKKKTLPVSEADNKWYPTRFIVLVLVSLQMSQISDVTLAQQKSLI